MVGSRKWFRAIGDPTREAFLHAHETCLNSTVVVDEILDTEFKSVLAAKDDPKCLRERCLSHRGEHLRVAAKLNGVIRLGERASFVSHTRYRPQGSSTRKSANPANGSCSKAA
jgi:hypothetical protein